MATEDTVKKNPELARRFLRAWTKGLDRAIHNQKVAIEGLRQHNPEINEAEFVANLEEIVRISQRPDTETYGLGWQDMAVWEKQEEFMRDQGLTPAKVDVSAAMTDDLFYRQNNKQVASSLEGC